MKKTVHKYSIILSISLLCSMCLFTQMNAHAYYTPDAALGTSFFNGILNPAPGYFSALGHLQVSPLSYGAFTDPYMNIMLSSIAGGYGFYGQNGVNPNFIGMERILQSNTSDNAIRTSPGNGIQDLNWNPLGISINPLGLMNAFAPINIPFGPYINPTYPGAGFPGMGFGLMGLPGTGLQGVLPGIGIPGILPPSLMIPGIGLPGIGFIQNGFAQVSNPYENIQGMQNGNQYVSSETTVQVYDPSMDILSDFPLLSLPDFVRTTLNDLPIIPDPSTIFAPIPDFMSRMYVAATIEDVAQTIYILLMGDGEDTALSLEDITNEGLYCIKVKNLPGVKTSYKLTCGEECYTLSLFMEINSPTSIWAWDTKWWQQG